MKFIIVFATLLYFVGTGECQTSSTLSDDTVPEITLEELPPEERSGDCKCGQRKLNGRTRRESLQNQRIVGGQVAQLNEFPWRCALMYQNGRGSLSYFCSCSIISSQWIMSAAHCTDLTRGTKIFVDVGDHDLSSKTETKNTMVEVESYKQHERYNRQNQDNDISLLKLKTPLTFDEKVSPVCLPFALRRSTFERQIATVSGWGVTQEGSVSQPTALRKVDLPVLSLQQCRRYFGLFGFLAVTNNMICTLQTGKDACQGDSGSSLDAFDARSGRSYAIGVVSHGVGCARRNSPGVYTRVTRMLDWIKTTTGERFCEQ